MFECSFGFRITISQFGWLQWVNQMGNIGVRQPIHLPPQVKSTKKEKAMIGYAPHTIESAPEASKPILKAAKVSMKKGQTDLLESSKDSSMDSTRRRAVS